MTIEKKARNGIRALMNHIAGRQDDGKTILSHCIDNNTRQISRQELFVFDSEALEAMPELRKWQGKPKLSISELEAIYDDKGVPYIRNISGTAMHAKYTDDNGMLLKGVRIIKHW